jgi:hypothetical protein
VSEAAGKQFYHAAITTKTGPSTNYFKILGPFPAEQIPGITHTVYGHSSEVIAVVTAALEMAAPGQVFDIEVVDPKSIRDPKDQRRMWKYGAGAKDQCLNWQVSHTNIVVVGMHMNKIHVGYAWNFAHHDPPDALANMAPYMQVTVTARESNNVNLHEVYAKLQHNLTAYEHTGVTRNEAGVLEIIRGILVITWPDASGFAAIPKEQKKAWTKTVFMRVDLHPDAPEAIRTLSDTERSVTTPSPFPLHTHNSTIQLLMRIYTQYTQHTIHSTYSIHTQHTIHST